MSVMTRFELVASVRLRASSPGRERTAGGVRRLTASSGTPRRTVRVDDELWQAAAARAAERGEDLSAVIRRALAEYAAGPPREEES